jgi:glycosyltransferase involved in cell wall biosynthesis
MGLAEALLRAGHDVTYLYTGGAYSEAEPVEYWVARYAEVGLKVAPLPESDVPINNHPEICTSYLTYKWLQAHDDFDVVHFHEWRGHGYYSLLAKHQGLAFERATLCVSVHSPSLWKKRWNHELVDHVIDLEVDYLERESVALADVLISSSRYMLEWLSGRGWSLPPKCSVLPNLLPASARARPNRAGGGGPGGDGPVEEFVFLGRLECRTGLALFCDALDRLAAGPSRPFRATFLGESGSIEGEPGLEYIRRRSRDWSFPWQAIAALDNVQTVDYLSQPGRLAIVPSMMDNSPLAVHECLLAGIPFLASRVGGIPELVRAEDHPSVLFPPRAAALAGRMEAALRDPVRPARPAFDEGASRDAWLAWHRGVLGHTDPASVIGPCGAAQPRVSVCIAHFNRPEHLRHALESLQAQDYPNFEVIVVDDGSTSPAAVAYLDALEPEFADRGWRIVRQENLYPGAARNNAARHATGEYLLFMDDDNVAKPHEISRFIQVANRTRADILTCFIESIESDDPIQVGQTPKSITLCLGASLAVGAFYNCLGDTNALVRRDSFLAIGGFTEDWGHNHEDKELYARAIFKGLRLLVIPEALYLYRSSNNSLITSTSSYLNNMRGLRPYFENLAEPIYQVVMYAHAQFMKGLSPPLPTSPVVQPVAPAESPLRYRIADRINLVAKRIVPLHRVARASLIFIVVRARRLKHLARRIVAIARSYPRDPGRSLQQQPSVLRGPHKRAREVARYRWDRRG